MWTLRRMQTDTTASSQASVFFAIKIAALRRNLSASPSPIRDRVRGPTQ